jgi:hypothetical protein
MMNKQTAAPFQRVAPPEAAGDENLIPVHGFEQIVEMLRIADDAFRDSLLRRIALKDRELARSLRMELGV